MPALEVRNLGFTYPRRRASPERRALDGVSFTVAPGTFLGLFGPNGGGKSTLLRLLATLLPPQEGSVAVFGRPLPAEAAAVRRRLGVIFQTPSLDLQLSVEENLRTQGHLYGLRGRDLSRRIGEALERLGLADRRGERAESLSGGLRRRAEIAKALLHDPDLLLLDEPSTGLDPGARRSLRETLVGLAEGGVTLVLTTHFVDEAERCHRLLLLDRGRVVADGSPEGLTAEIGGTVITAVPRGEPETFARELVARFPELQVADGSGEGGGRAVRFEHPDGHGFVARLAEAFPGRIDSITIARPNLEDVFLRHTGHPLYEREQDPGGAP